MSRDTSLSNLIKAAPRMRDGSMTTILQASVEEAHSQSDSTPTQQDESTQSALPKKTNPTPELKSEPSVIMKITVPRSLRKRIAHLATEMELRPSEVLARAFIAFEKQ